MVIISVSSVSPISHLAKLSRLPQDCYGLISTSLNCQLPSLFSLLICRIKPSLCRPLVFPSSLVPSRKPRTVPVILFSW